ncbi:lamin tail domain-containing protein [Chryseobacterium sp. MMS23-Vi53]|uniref:lamin tail domain-containing protein n=1 Tax=Chryseobacterium sp. MMS23-Vi53 TaxID=3386644 RepID=UPI0039EA1F29
MRKIFTFIGFVSMIAFSNAQIVINEIYGGGGNAGSTLKNDYVILKNIGSTQASLNGATLQYAPAASTFTQYHTLPNITLNPGQTYLIQEATGGGGTVNLPTPDFIATTVINFDGSPNPSVGIGIAVTSGKIVIANNAVQVTGPTSSNVVDFVGYGSAANQYEGSGPAPSPTTTTAIKRISGDTNDNTVDFTVGAANPINSTGGTLAIADVDFNYSKFNFIKNSFVKDNEIIFGGEINNVKVFNMFGQVVKESPTKSAYNLDVKELPKGNYIVTGTIDDNPVSQKILKD